MKSNGKWKRPLLIAVLLTLILVLTITSIVFVAPNNPGPTASLLPESVRGKTSFSVLYPTQLPRDYTLDKNSLKVIEGNLFYEVQNHEGTIVVSEQAAPSIPPNFDKLDGFNKLTLSVGEAVIGTNGGVQLALILTKSTLVTVRGESPQVSRNSIISTAKSLSIVQH